MLKHPEIYRNTKKEQSKRLRNEFSDSAKLKVKTSKKWNITNKLWNRTVEITCVMRQPQDRFEKGEDVS